MFNYRTNRVPGFIKRDIDPGYWHNKPVVELRIDLQWKPDSPTYRTAAVFKPDPAILDDIVKKISGLIPPGLSQAKDDLKANIKSILSQSLTKVDLVSREEFDIQTKVLLRTREKLEQLEAKIEELEKTHLQTKD